MDSAATQPDTSLQNCTVHTGAHKTVHRTYSEHKKV